MNEAVYTHKKANLKKLQEKQSKVYRELKNLWRSNYRKFIIPREVVFKLEDLEAENNSLVAQIKNIEASLLSFELFNQ